MISKSLINYLINKISVCKIITFCADFSFYFHIVWPIFAQAYMTARGWPRIQTTSPDLGHEPIPRPISNIPGGCASVSRSRSLYRTKNAQVPWGWNNTIHVAYQNTERFCKRFVKFYLLWHLYTYKIIVMMWKWKYLLFMYIK